MALTKRQSPPPDDVLDDELEVDALEDVLAEESDDVLDPVADVESPDVADEDEPLDELDEPRLSVL